jgi:HdeA/HdeB family
MDCLRVLSVKTAVELPVIPADEHAAAGSGHKRGLTAGVAVISADLNKQERKFFMRRYLIIAAALLGASSAAQAQVELKNYADANGYIDVQQLTCAQLAGTFQEDADFLGIWYSGWYNGLAKKHAINVSRTKEGIHNVIVYCKANPTKKVIQAIDVILKAEKN